VPITSDGCAEVITHILQEKIRFTAIFAFSDMIAWDVWTCLRKRGFKIPEDYSLIGFDNIQSRLTIPFQLSTISSSKGRMSNTAVDCLMCIMRGEQASHTECGGLCSQVLDTELVKGETVREPSVSFTK
jgi:LacI family transcriptional regulator